jgi:hypothetical protein
MIGAGMEAGANAWLIRLLDVEKEGFTISRYEDSVKRR